MEVGRAGTGDWLIIKPHEKHQAEEESGGSLQQKDQLLSVTRYSGPSDGVSRHMHPGHWMLLRPCLVYAAASDMGCRKTKGERQALL